MMLPYLCALDDRGRWGAMALFEAASRGWWTRLIAWADEVPEGSYAFLRIDQVMPRLAKEQEVARQLAGRGDVKLIPDITQILLYEDKVAQAEVFAEWMPPTVIVRSLDCVASAIDVLGLPLISKAAQGSASHDVRLIYTHEEAKAEAQRAFSPDGIRGSLGVQKGYLLWQKFCAGNAYDYRVVCNGFKRLVLKRFNRPDRPMASGSGLTEPVDSISGETADVLERANAFFAAARTQWCGIDMVHDPDDGAWKVLETTLGWTLKAYLALPYFEMDGRPTGHRGTDQFKVLCDGIAAGEFG